MTATPVEQGTLSLGEAARAAGVAAVVARLTPAERAEIAATILEVADRLPTFTADDVRRVLRVGLCEKLDAFPNALGGLMLQAAKRNLIAMTGAYAYTTRPERRHGRIAMWRRTERGGSR